MSGVPAGWEVGEKGGWGGVGRGLNGLDVMFYLSGCTLGHVQRKSWGDGGGGERGGGGGGMETDRKTEREKQRETDRKTDRGRETDRNRLRDRDKEDERQRQTKTATETGRKTYRKRHRYTTVNEMAERRRENWGGVVSWGAE